MLCSTERAGEDTPRFRDYCRAGDTLTAQREPSFLFSGVGLYLGGESEIGIATGPGRFPLVRGADADRCQTLHIGPYFFP